MQALELPLVSCWTGSVAAWAPFPAQAQPLGFGLPALKSSSRGVWLKSAAGGVLTVQLLSDAPPLLLCSLRRNVELVRAPLLPASFTFKLLCPQHSTGSTAGGSGGHLLLLSLAAPATSSASEAAVARQQQHEQPHCTIAVQFDTVQAGRECGALLQAIQAGRLKTAAQPQARSKPTAVVASVAAADQCTHAQQQQQAWPEAQHSQQARIAVTDMGTGAADEEALGATTCAPARLGYANDVALAAAIQAVQADPEFLAYMERLERAVEAVEGLMLGGGSSGEGT